MFTLTAGNFLLIASVLVFVAIMVTRAGYRFGVPALLLFLVVGMAFGQGMRVHFADFSIAQFVGMAALSVILFSGGMDTRFSEIRPVLAQGILLSTLGVILTSAFTGVFAFFLAKVMSFPMPMTLGMSLLLAAVMSSTDSATVFSILRNNNMKLKNNLQPVLELESGSNDPMAYCVTIVIMGIVKSSHSVACGADVFDMVWGACATFFSQMIIGAVAGVAIGMLAIKVINKVNLKSDSLYSILILSIAFFTMAVTQLIGGSGYLAVYIAGLVIGNRPIVKKREISRFMDGMTWLMQIAMFLTLGLFARTDELLKVAPAALLVGAFMMLVGRPLAVFITLAPFKGISFRSKSLISWVGLKGAAPIIFATYPILAGIDGADGIFNIVFFITIVSMLLQGMTIPSAARLLKLDLPHEKKVDTLGIEFPEDAGRFLDCVLTEGDLKNGNTLKEVEIPEGTRVVMVQRGAKLIVPDGRVKLEKGDKLLLIRPEGTAEE